jgi:hypothetical protein
MSDRPDDGTASDDKGEGKHSPDAWLPEAHFGSALAPLPEAMSTPDDDDDDGEDEDVPPDVVWMLGFNPADENDDLGDNADDDAEQ